MAAKLVLASSSPRRQELLSLVHIPFTIRKPSVDESSISTTNPVDKVRELATLKGRNLAFSDENEVILSADTVVSYKHKIFEKPKSKDNAYQILSTLSGEIHQVYSGVYIRSTKKEITFVECTEVEFWPLDKDLITWYISTSDPYDKAGAYGIQSIGAMFVKKIVGDYYNVVGLPISRVVRELKEFSVTPL